MRTYPVVLGALTVAVFGPFTALSATGSSPPALLVLSATATALAGLLLVGSGIVDGVPVGPFRARWYHLLGTGVLLHAVAALGLREVLAASADAPWSAAAWGSSSLVFVWTGGDFLRGGVHHDISELE